MNYLEYKLDEDYPFLLKKGGEWDRTGNRLEIPVYGTATICYRSSDDWWMTDLVLDASNGRYGDASKGWEEPIYHEHPLYGVIEFYLNHGTRERVEEMIVADIKDRRDSYLFDEGKERAKLRGMA